MLAALGTKFVVVEDPETLERYCDRRTKRDAARVASAAGGGASDENQNPGPVMRGQNTQRKGPGKKPGPEMIGAWAASRSQLDTLALQLALNGVEGDLKREYRKRRPADDGGASKDQERRHLNSPQNGVATRMAATVNILPAGQAGSFLGLM